MIIIKLTGGLGNQLFQYANGLARAMKADNLLAIDISWYKGRIDRTYLLDNFNIKANIASKISILWKKLWKKEEYIIGDWQSEKYFQNIYKEIRKEFTLKKTLSPEIEVISQQIKSRNSVSIHLRGGDYVRGKKSSFHGVCSPEYYSKSIEYIKGKIQSPHFFIFTDDIEWARNHISFPEPYTLVSNITNKPYEELIIMSQCKHNIIANSTFSWWAAWLNNHPEKIVLAPKKWFNDEKINTSDILPSSWIKM